MISHGTGGRVGGKKGCGAKKKKKDEKIKVRARRREGWWILILPKLCTEENAGGLEEGWNVGGIQSRG